MARIIKRPEENPQSQPAWKSTQLPTDKPCQVYPRVSSPAQKKNISSEMQKDKSFAISCGWAEHVIIMDDRDLGVSGQLRMEDRVAFNAMNNRIRNGEIGAVVVAKVDRLFRERWGVEYNKFMEMCNRYGVVVVTDDFVYDFSVSWHVDKFRRRCEEAWNYLEQHVLGRMLPARDFLGMNGYWACGNIAVGFTVDRVQRRKKIFPYKPHADKLVEVFELYRECHGSLSETYRRLELSNFLFPPFVGVDEELVRRFTLLKVLGVGGELVGYKFGSLTGLASVLSNPVYVGAWIFKGNIIEHNHEAIVSEDLFFYAFNRLSPVMLDGSKNPNKTRKYTKRYRVNGHQILKSVMQSGDGEEYHIYPDSYESKDVKMRGEMLYVYQIHVDAPGRVKRGLVSYESDKIDSLVMGKLVDLLKGSDEYENYQEHSTRNQEPDKLLARISQDIIDTQAAMKRNVQTVTSGTITAPDMLKALNEQQLRLGLELERLVTQSKKLENQKSIQQRRMEYSELMLRLGESWKEVMTPDLLVDAVALFIEKVVLTTVSPLLFTLDIVWCDPAWSVSTALCIRDSQRSKEWSEEEDKLLREFYPTAAIEDILRMLPTRTLTTIRRRASIKGIGREYRGERPESHTLSYLDLLELERRGIAIPHEERGTPTSKRRRVHSEILLSWSTSPLKYSYDKLFDPNPAISFLQHILN